MSYPISPLRRNRIKHYSSTLIPHHRWAEMELKYRKLNYLRKHITILQKLNSSIGSNLISFIAAET
jgi:hypothetical protein